MKAKSPWWKSQYLDPAIIDVMFGWRTETAAEVEQILNQLRLPTGSRVLDLACGQGRHSIELAKRGYQVTGLDFSPVLLATAQKKAKSLPKSIRPVFVEADMRKLKQVFRKGSFDAVVNLWNAWGYFDRRSDDQKVLDGISHVLAPGGLAVINTLNGSGVEHAAWTRSPRDWRDEGKDRYFLQEFSYDPATQKLHANWILLAPKKKLVKRYVFSQNVYSTQEFKKAFQNSGLRMTKLWGMLEGKPYSKISWHQTLVAKKI